MSGLKKIVLMFHFHIKMKNKLVDVSENLEKGSVRARAFDSLADLMCDTQMGTSDYEDLRWDPEEFDRGAVPATVFNEVTQRLVREEQYGLVNESQLRRDRDWSAVGGQVAGFESY